MNVGPDSRHYWEYVENQRWARLSDPCWKQDCSAGMGVNSGGAYLWWHNPPGAVRVAFLACLPDGKGGCARYRYLGVSVAVNGQAYQGQHIDSLGTTVGEFLCLNIESGANTIAGRNDQCPIGPK